MFFKKDDKKIDDSFLIKVGALLIHTAKIDENYTDNEEEIIKKTLLELGSDENADMYETNLMRRLSGLLYLDPKNVGDIKEKVRQKKI